jgi:hypothetical protein
MTHHSRFNSTTALLPLALCLLTASRIPAAVAQAPNSAPSPAGNLQLPSGDPRENLQDLSLRGSSLQVEPPLSGGTAQNADFTRELYQMQWRAGDPIDVYVIRPRGVAKPPVAIYLYGFPGEGNRFRNDTFCRLVTRGGVAAIGFVPAMTGERYHDVPMRMWFVSELHDSIVKSVHDVQMIANYAATRADLDGGRIGIFGQGAGATIAGLAATVDPRIQAVDLLDPWGDWPDWVAKSKLVPDNERPDYEKPEFLQPLAPLDPVQWLPQLASRSLKLDDALYETTTPAEAKAKMEAVLPAASLLVRYPTQADFEKNAITDGKLVAWIQDQLLAKHASHSANPSASPDSKQASSDSAQRASAHN